MEVKTFSGNIVPRENCRRIKKQFYEINVDCFLVDGKWHRVNNGLITKNYSTGTYIKVVDAENSCIFGIADVQDGKPVLGFFSSHENLAVFIKLVAKGGNLEIQMGDGKQTIGELPPKVLERLSHSKQPWLYCRNRETLNKLGNYDFSFDNDILYPRTSEYQTKFVPSLGKGYGGLSYGSDNALNVASLKHKNNYKRPITREHYHLAKLLGKYSFGLEFETRNGYIATPLVEELGLIPVRDGSLRLENGKEPYEFVTVPLQGGRGISTLDSICSTLTERTTFDDRCSLHVHLGNVPYDEMFIITFTKLIGMIQKEMLSIFPKYKLDPSIIGSSKNYCQLLPNEILPKTISNLDKLNKLEYEEFISANFNPIYTFVSDGQSPNRSYNRKILQHPVNNQKWHIKSRYHIINLVPLMFKNFRTIEFRVHTPTTNRYKVFNWLLIVAALAKFAETHQKDIISKSKITFAEIFETVYDTQTADRLNTYIESRKSWFKGGEDSKGSIERKGDAKYSESRYA